jgi:hypothetical protein
MPRPSGSPTYNYCFSLQKDYNHQVQNEFQHLYQVMEQNRQNHITGIRGSHNKSRQIGKDSFPVFGVIRRQVFLPISILLLNNKYAQMV